MNRLVDADLPVTVEYVTADQVPEGVRLDRLPDDVSDTLRLVRIGDYDVCPCAGLHVSHTRQIGRFVLLGTNWTRRNTASVSASSSRRPQKTPDAASAQMPHFTGVVPVFTSVVPEISIVVPVNSIAAIVFTGITLEFMGAVSLVPIVVNIIYLAVSFF